MLINIIYSNHGLALVLGSVPLHIVVGGFFGDEGKGKITAYFSLSRGPSYVARTGASNAGHTVVYKGQRYRLRIVPSGFINSGARLIVARGALVSLDVLLREVEELGVGDRFLVDELAGIITKEHVERERRDAYLMSHVGSTGTGVGAAMVDRVLRRLRLARDYPVLKRFLADTQSLLLEALDRGDLVLVEASQGYWLSLYHGTYPFVTSRDTTASAALSELGLGPRHVERITVVFKAYVTRVGAGPLPGEMSREEVEKLGWVEYGTVTGRPRRVAPFSTELARRAVRANTATDIAITKLDKVFPETRCAKTWEKLPRRARQWVEMIEESVGAPVSVIGTGEEVGCTIDRSEEVLAG